MVQIAGGRPMNEFFKRRVIPNLILFLVSTTMVAGFFFHGEFYQFGFAPLLLVGGVVVFVVLKIISMANSEKTINKNKPTKTLLFPKDVVNSVMFGEIKTTIRPFKISRLRVGTVCNVRTTITGRSLGTILITDVRRKRLEELGDKDTRPEGDRADEFRKKWLEKHGGKSDQIIRIIEFQAT
jgi:hypothetical protein